VGVGVSARLPPSLSASDARAPRQRSALSLQQERQKPRDGGAASMHGAPASQCAYTRSSTLASARQYTAGSAVDGRDSAPPKRPSGGGHGPQSFAT
jgi:hypothetical protein